MNTTEAQQEDEQRDRERDPAFDEFFCEGCGQRKDECACCPALCGGCATTSEVIRLRTSGEGHDAQYCHRCGFPTYLRLTDEDVRS